MPISLDQDSWFVAVYYDPQTGEERPISVHRWYKDDDGITRFEMFDRIKDDWVPNPALIRATGIGGDNHYEPTTEEYAMQLVREFRNAT